MSDKAVVVIQKYVPEYRKHFFELLEEEMKSRGLRLILEVDGKETFNNEPGDAVVPEVNISFHNSHSISTLWGRIFVRPINRLDFSADVVVIEQALKNFTNLLVLFSRRLLNKKTVVWGHGIDFVNPKGPFKKILRLMLVRVADMTFVYTESAKNALIEAGISEGKLIALNNSTDTRDLIAKLSQLTYREISDFKAKHRITENNLLYLGSFAENKNLDLLFDSVIYARKLIPDLTFTILGSGPLESKVVSFVEANKWACFLGRAEHQKLLALSTAKLIVMAGRVGLVATDSFASGVPIVTVENDFHAPEFDYLDPPHDSLVFASDSVSFGYGISKALDKNSIEKLRKGVLKKRDKFSIEIMASNFRKGINRVLEN